MAAAPGRRQSLRAFARALESGDQELCGRMQDTTIAVSRVLTVARRSAGIRFPCDRCPQKAISIGTRPDKTRSKLFEYLLKTRIERAGLRRIRRIGRNGSRRKTEYEKYENSYPCGAAGCH